MLIKLTAIRKFYVPPTLSKKGKIKEGARTERRAFDVYLNPQQVKYAQQLDLGLSLTRDDITGPPPVTEVGLTDELVWHVLEPLDAVVLMINSFDTPRTEPNDDLLLAKRIRNLLTDLDQAPAEFNGYERFVAELQRILPGPKANDPVTIWVKNTGGGFQGDAWVICSKMDEGAHVAYVMPEGSF